MTKLIAFYLPQFHDISENDQWWGKGFTEWVNVKNAKPLFENHAQPRAPLNGNYYDLRSDEAKLWQARLARQYGVYGFAYYHYWFGGKLLLEKPMEQMLSNPKIDLPFCISWANETWTKAWVGEERKVLIPQRYGGEKEWKEHFDYLLPFFKDARYILDGGRPLFILYRPEAIPCLNEMLDCWNRLAVEAGFPGLCFAYQSNDFDWMKDRDDSRFSYDIEFQPDCAEHYLKAGRCEGLRRLRRGLARVLERWTGVDLYRYGRGALDGIMGQKRMDYDATWRQILRQKPLSAKSLPGAFVAWDNSPRHGTRAKIYANDTPEKFAAYLSQQIRRARDTYNSQYLFLYAWNEWAEGGYLEPDTRFGYGYLEAVKKALEENGAFPVYPQSAAPEAAK